MNQPPRTLNELLEDFNSYNSSSNNRPTTDNNSCADVDTAITNHIWARRFRDYLRKRDLEDEETALKFLIATQPLKVKSDQAQKLNNNTKKQKVILKDMEDVYFETVRQFFKEESETVLCLANATHFAKICERSEQLERETTTKKEGLKDEDIDLLLRARDDMDVWQNGVEPTYMKFLASAGSAVSPMACLLSIL